MTESEAIQLIDSDAARLGISDLLTDEYRQALVNQSSGHPYVIKIMLGEVSKEKCLKKPERIIATQGQILQALFERTYSALSPAAQRIFLLLSTWRSIVPSLAIEAVVMRSADELIDVRSAIEELKRLSFIEEIAPAEGEEIFISLPLAALSFGQKKLNASALKAVIEADSELLQEFGAIRKEGTSSGIKIRISHLVKALAKRVASGKEELQSFRSMLEFVGSRVPAAWLDISRLYIEEGKEPGREWAKDALRRFIESDDDSTPKALIWQNLADLCNATADLQKEVQALVELANVSNTSTEDLSLIADRINRSFANAKRDGNVLFQADERKHLFGKLIRQLEARLAYLDPTDLSRLAWLYMHIGNEERAYTLAKRGLEMDSENDYCIRLVQKIG
jgi:tetratricopeptide (TPR) repeat protein